MTNVNLICQNVGSRFPARLIFFVEVVFKDCVGFNHVYNIQEINNNSTVVTEFDWIYFFALILRTTSGIFVSKQI